MSKKLFKIGDLAEHFGISTDIIRHYDKIGLLRPQVIKDNGYRYYSIDQIFDLEFILNMRALDMPLQDIGEMLDPASSVNIQTRLETQASALKDQISSLQAMLDQTEKYQALVNPDPDNLNTWYIGTRPEINYLGAFFNVKHGPNLAEFRHVTGNLKKNWFHDMNIFIRSELSMLKAPNTFEEVSHFSYGAYETIPAKNTSVLANSKALVYHFHAEESYFDACYEQALEIINELQLTPKDYIYSLDAFGWRSGGKVYLSTDLYIDLE